MNQMKILWIYNGFENRQKKDTLPADTPPSALLGGALTFAGTTAAL
jgi:hypothetical protein